MRTLTILLILGDCQIPLFTSSIGREREEKRGELRKTFASAKHPQVLVMKLQICSSTFRKSYLFKKMVKLWEKRRSRAMGSEFPKRSAISLVAFLAFRSAFFNAFRASLDGVNFLFSADID